MIKRYYSRAYAVLSSLIVALFVGAIFSRCASIGNPEGGPKDSLPPMIVELNPENFTTNMDPYLRRVYIGFDEFVKLQDQQKEFFTSPAMKNKPQLQIRGRGIVVTLRDTLLENTTYALNFGSSIQDNNEGNPLNSMRYVFSTGDRIDSMIMSGYTESSYTADSVSKTFIFLYPADSISIEPTGDSTLFNKKPAVIARAENNGIFMAQNLKPIPYYLYALEDTNSNMTYEPGTDRVGFIEGTYNPSEMAEFSIWYDSLRRYVVAEPQTHFRLFTDKAFARQLLVDSERKIQHKATLFFGAANPVIDSIIFDSLPADRVMTEYLTKGRDTIALWFNAPAEQIPDTLRGRIVYFKHDSLSQITRVSENLNLTWRFIETKEQQQKREREEKERKRAEESGEEWIEPEVKNPFKVTYPTESKFNPERTLVFDFDYPLTLVDTASIRLQYLSPQAVALRESLGSSEEGGTQRVARGNSIPFSFSRDTMNIRRWHLNAEWGEAGSEYYLSIPDKTFTDILGQQNDTITNTYTPYNKEEFATLIVNVAADTIRPSHYIIDLMDASGKNVLESKKGVEAGKVTFNYIKPGDVSLRIVQDVNNNGEWDSGDLLMRRQAERVQFFEQDGERTITTKANWEIEVSVNPEQLFAIETQEQLVQRLEKQERRRVEKLEKERAEKAGKGGGGGGGHNH